MDQTTKRIIAARTAKNLSQRKLAALANIPPSTLRDIEAGRVVAPRTNTIAAIAQALALTPNDLLGDQPENITININQTTELLASFAQLDPNHQQLILTIIQQLRPNTQCG